MDSPEKNAAEAQTTKVAETNNGEDMSTNTPMADTKQEESTWEAESTQQDALKAQTKTKQSAQSPPTTSRSPEQTLKRPASRSPSPSTKRQRTSPSPSTSGHFLHPSRQVRVRSIESPPTAPRAAPRARPDDKARTRRLFGGMLNTIAAKPSSRRAPYEAPRRVDPAKRVELERKAAEREKVRLKEEREARRERELRRREENRERYMRWERDTMMARCENERMKAEYLRTDARPELYYKPYILTSDQKDMIKRQIEDTELLIEKDIRKYKEAHPDQDPLPWIAKKDTLRGGDYPQDEKIEEDTPEVSPPAPETDESVDKMDGGEERQQEQKKEKMRTDEFDEEVIETEGGVSLIY